MMNQGRVSSRWVSRLPLRTGRESGLWPGGLAQRGRKLDGACKRSLREEGAALVETAVSMSIYLMVLFGLIEISLALYTYNFVSDAARIATRYAAVRGSGSCTISPTFPNCDLGPSGSTHTAADLQNYVRNLGYPGMTPNNLTLTATWLSPSSTTPVTWGPCAAAPCNSVGDAVQVNVIYQFPLNIPFWRNATLNVGSTSQMIINE
jgi:Flp pilus assembly protein TadG